MLRQGWWLPLSSPFIIIDEIKTAIDSMNTSLTSKIDTIDGIVDTINSNVSTIKTETAKNSTASESGTLSQKLASVISYTKTNNNESSTGILSQKMTYLINRRLRGVKPSSTNIKTFSSSLSTGSTSTGNSNSKVYSSYTSEFVVAYSGRYRAYCTGTVTVSSLYTRNGSSLPTDMNILGFEVCVNGNTVSTIDVATQGASVGTSAAATKTVDLTLEAGQVVKMRIYAHSKVYSVVCSHTCYSNVIKASCTDLSIRGTTVELTGPAIV